MVVLVVSMLASFSDDPSSNPAEVYSFSVKCLKRTQNKQIKRPGLARVFKRLYWSHSAWSECGGLLALSTAVNLPFYKCLWSLSLLANGTFLLLSWGHCNLTSDSSTSLWCDVLLNQVAPFSREYSRLPIYFLMGKYHCTAGFDSAALLHCFYQQMYLCDWIQIGSIGGQLYGDTSPYEVSIDFAKSWS